MRKILYFIAVFTLLFLSADLVKADGVSMGVSGGGSYKVGATFNSSIGLSSGGNRICAVEFTLTYPSDLLEVTSTPSLGSVYTMSTAAENSASRIHYQLGATGCSTEDATLLTIPFKTKAQGEATLSLTDLAAYDGDGANIAVSGSSSVASITANTTSTSVSKKTTSSAKTTTTPAASTTPTVLNLPVIKNVSFLNSTVDPENPEISIKNSDEWKLVFMGTADPSVKVNVTINSDPIAASVQSDESGNWSYTLDQKIEDGAHQIVINTEKDGVKSTDVAADFVLDSTRVAFGKTLPEIKAVPVTTEATPEKENKYLTYAIYGGSALIFIGMVVFIALFVKRRKEHAAMLRSMTSFSEPAAVTVNPMDEISQSDQSMNIAQEISVQPQPNQVIQDQGLVDTPVQAEPSIPAPELVVQNSTVSGQGTIEHGFGGINKDVIANENAKTIPQADSSQAISEETQSNMPEQAAVENKQDSQNVKTDHNDNQLIQTYISTQNTNNTSIPAEVDIAVANNPVDQNSIPNDQNLPNSNQGQAS
ncbi:MAG: Ig-like domain-containing protein [Patescibacteria group bacterium]